MARAWLGSDPAYIGGDRLQCIDGDRVLRPEPPGAFGAGHVLERIASVRFGINDIRKIEEARVGG